MEQYFAPHLDKQALQGMTALGLAHMGDCVFELLVRTWLCTHGGSKVKDLHRATVAHVAAPAQAARRVRGAAPGAGGHRQQHKPDSLLGQRPKEHPRAGDS